MRWVWGAHVDSYPSMLTCGSAAGSCGVSRSAWRLLAPGAQHEQPIAEGVLSKVDDDAPQVRFAAVHGSATAG